MCCCMRRPPVYGCLPLLALLIVAAILFALLYIFEARLVLVGKTALFVAVLVSLPKVASLFEKYGGRVTQAIVSSILGTLLVTGYSTWVLGTRVLGLWIALLFSLFSLLLFGAFILDFRLNRIVARLSRSALLASYQTQRLQTLAKWETWFYISVPLGVAIALVYGRASSRSDSDILILESVATLGLAILILVVLLTVSAILMSSSLIIFDATANKPATIVEKEDSLIERLIGALQFQFSRTTDPQKTDFGLDLDMAYLVSDLRRFYFYDSVHNCTVLVGFSLAAISIVNISFVATHYILIGAVSLLFLFASCYLPFSIGQHNLHEVILDTNGLEGLARKDLNDKLLAASPLYPQSDFFSALVSTGTVGSLLAALAYEVLKNAIK